MKAIKTLIFLTLISSLLVACSDEKTNPAPIATQPGTQYPGNYPYPVPPEVRAIDGAFLYCRTPGNTPTQVIVASNDYDSRRGRHRNDNNDESNSLSVYTDRENPGYFEKFIVYRKAIGSMRGRIKEISEFPIQSSRDERDSRGRDHRFRFERSHGIKGVQEYDYTEIRDAFGLSRIVFSIVLEIDLRQGSGRIFGQSESIHTGPFGPRDHRVSVTSTDLQFVNCQRIAQE